MPDEMKSEEKLEEKARSYSKKAPKKSPRAEPVVVVRPPKMYSFEQWAARRGVPKHHCRGMRAFVKNPNRTRTLEMWDECFVGY